MRVNLTYFKPTGRYYSDGSYETNRKHLQDIWDEVRRRNEDGDLPGLCAGSSSWTILIDVPDHPHRHPRLIHP